jgi:hypothetical protein
VQDYALVLATVTTLQPCGSLISRESKMEIIFIPSVPYNFNIGNLSVMMKR